MQGRLESGKSYSGRWWLPGNNTQSPGSMVFDHISGTTLTIQGSLGAQRTPRGAEIPIILGEVFGVGNVTVPYSVENGGSISSGVRAVQFFARCLLVGEHFKTPDRIRFLDLSCSYPGLEQWAPPPELKVTIPWGRKRTGLVKFREPKEIRILGESDLTIEIHRRTGVSYGEHSADIKGSVYAIFKRRRSSLLETLLGDVFDLRDFLAFIGADPRNPTDLCGRLRRRKRGERPRFVGIHLAAAQSRVETSTSRTDLLFGIQDVDWKKQPVYSKWLANRERFRRPSWSYLKSVYNDSIPLENEFLDLLGAIEAHHRFHFNAGELPHSEHAARLAEILAPCPPRHQEWLKARLRYSNEPTLRKRLKEIGEKLPFIQENWFGKRLDIMQSLLDTRNFLTHSDRSLESRAATGTKLFTLNVRLRTMLAALILLDLGFDPEKIETMLRRNFYFARALDRDTS